MEWRSPVEENQCAWRLFDHLLCYDLFRNSINKWELIYNYYYITLTLAATFWLVLRELYSEAHNYIVSKASLSATKGIAR